MTPKTIFLASLFLQCYARINHDSKGVNGLVVPNLRHDLPVPDMIEREGKIKTINSAVVSNSKDILFEGYPVETHLVVTEDCYHLEMHRIPYGKSNKTTGKRPAVYLQHGLFCSSADWVMGIPEKSLGG